MYDFSKEIAAKQLDKETAVIIQKILEHHHGFNAWLTLQDQVFRKIKHFNVIETCYQLVYPNWQTIPGITWAPSHEAVAHTNLYRSIQELHIPGFQEFHRWSFEHQEEFWQHTLKKLGIHFETYYEKICDLPQGVTSPKWLPGAKYNIAENCFHGDKTKTAIIYKDDNGIFEKYSYEALEQFTNRIANGLIAAGFKPSDAVAINMPMNYHACAIYLALIKAGLTVVGIADSFAPEEIKTRLQIANAKAIFTQDAYIRGGKIISVYEKVAAANAPRAIVVQMNATALLRPDDVTFDEFISKNDSFAALPCDPDHVSNILFSSGTTGTPKAIAWTHVTPLRCAADAYYHQDIHENDILAWPTNLGWMMGPWLIYAGLINKATIALFDGNPSSGNFGKFVENSGITMLGVVPSIVKNWRMSQCMETYDWSRIKCFSSSAESSNICDMLYLMWLAKFKPIIEYCGGTEIGGAYISSTLIQPNAPAAFTTPTVGMDFVMIDSENRLTNNGEVAMIPPALGLSNTLLNRNHFEEYYQDMPEYEGKPLRRHGDHIEKINENFYRALGRIDDTMNLGGIKVSSIEIERVINFIPEVLESAAVTVNPKDGGPSKLIIFIVSANGDTTKIKIKHACNNSLKEKLNPLFKISDIVFLKKLPRTASNKIMRRILRDDYVKKPPLHST